MPKDNIQEEIARLYSEGHFLFYSTYAPHFILWRAQELSFNVRY